MQFCCLWKIYSCLFTPNCTRNHVITCTNCIRYVTKLNLFSFHYKEYQALHEKYMSLKKSYSEQEMVSGCGKREVRHLRSVFMKMIIWFFFFVVLGTGRNGLSFIQVSTSHLCFSHTFCSKVVSFWAVFRGFAQRGFSMGTLIDLFRGSWSH